MDHPLFIWWRRQQFESSLSLDRPLLRFGHPQYFVVIKILMYLHMPGRYILA